MTMYLYIGMSHFRLGSVKVIMQIKLSISFRVRRFILHRFEVVFRHSQFRNSYQKYFCHKQLLEGRILKKKFY